MRVVTVDRGISKRIDFEDNETTTFRDLAKQMLESRETYLYGVDELTLYLEKRDGKWLRSDSYDVDLFVWGEFPDSIRALLTEENKVDLRDLACNFDFRRADCFPHDEIHMILDPPERVKRLYRQHRQETQHFNERLRRAAIARAARRACATERSGSGLLCGIGTALLSPWKSLASIFAKVEGSRVEK
ncbi:hypothetical protein GN958_ATG17076 [Phytophthora infestans]|uniref:Crinkler (CRN) family protein n=1 Tax=Phytophthora infestans TaxID=4787 RepID=A0A8S9U3K3_PHYIN|nr:hypothetical protein GN958_ATG17076 [Phytophthora infestans]